MAQVYDDPLQAQTGAAAWERQAPATAPYSAPAGEEGLRRLALQVDKKNMLLFAEFSDRG